MKKILTGIKPTGKLHLGNYSSAIEPVISQSKDHNSNNLVTLMCADLHGLSDRRSILEPGSRTKEVLATFIALGFNYTEHRIIVQSQFPEISEIAWYLSCVTNLGLLQRGHAYKDAVANGKDPTAGLFFYPVLMASDIISFDSDLVPVGKDQTQHLEFTSDIVKSFNNCLNTDVLKEPHAVYQESVELVGTDGRKMSKSYNNTIPIFEEPKKVEKIIKGITTDSKDVNTPKDAEACYIFQILKSFASQECTNYMKDKLESGNNYGYGHAKADLLDEYNNVFGGERFEKFIHLSKSENELSTIIEPSRKSAKSEVTSIRDRIRSALALM